MKVEITPVIQITEKCNLKCTYCLRPSFEVGPMNEIVLENIIKKTINHNKKSTGFVWNGGEPLTADREFFQKIVELQNYYNTRGVPLRNTIQTNATLLDEWFVEFFKENNFLIGASIDGSREIHNLHRITKSKKGTYDKIIEKIQPLEREVGGIFVLTKKTIGNEEEIYYSLKPYIKGFRISEYFPSHCGSITADQFLPTPIEYGESMVRYYQIWKRDNNPLDVKPITNIIKSFVLGESAGCLYSQKICFSIVGIDPTGDVYTCARSFQDKRYLLGNIITETFDDLESKILSPDKNQRISALLKGDCGSCEFWNYCNGGCPQESLKIYGDLLHKTYYCEGRKILFTAILNDIKRLPG